MSSAPVKFLDGPGGITAKKLNLLQEQLLAAIGSGGTGTGTGVWGETPTGAINGANHNYTSTNAYAANSLAVFLNGLRQRRSADYTETGSNSFSFVTAPLAGDSLSIDYIRP